MKRCPKCEQDKSLSEWNRGSTGGTQSYCRECTRQKDREYYARNIEDRKAKVRQRANEAIRQAKLFLVEIKKSGCSLCDENELCCLEFHHLDAQDKDFNIADAVQYGYSVERIKVEIAKCVLLCANCHRKVHAGVKTINY